MRGALIGLVYEETMKARTSDQGDITAITLMGTDVERIVFALQVVHELWGSVLDMAIAIWLLEQQVFLACVAPVALIVGIYNFPDCISS
jgi:ATP-binding cassette subfamily C (CFTR/MRP) protein 1